MSIWQFQGVLTFNIVTFMFMLSTDWKRWLLGHHGEKNP